MVGHSHKITTIIKPVPFSFSFLLLLRGIVRRETRPREGGWIGTERSGDRRVIAGRGKGAKAAEGQGSGAEGAVAVSGGGRASHFVEPSHEGASTESVFQRVDLSGLPFRQVRSLLVLGISKHFTSGGYNI